MREYETAVRHYEDLAERDEMTMDLDTVLDEAVAESDREAWLVRRAGGFGSSDLGALWVVLGWVDEDTLEGWDGLNPDGTKRYRTPRYIIENARRMRTGWPRLIEEKALLRKPRKQSDAMRMGKEREALIFQQSRLGQWDAEAVYWPDVKELPERYAAQLVGGNPWVLRDVEEPRLLCTLEASEQTKSGLRVHELKSDRWGNRTEPPWYQARQVVGAAAVMRADLGSIQYAGGWAMADEPAFRDLPDPVEWDVPITTTAKALTRKACRLGWEMVEACLAERAKKGTYLIRRAVALGREMVTKRLEAMKNDDER